WRFLYQPAAARLTLPRAALLTFVIAGGYLTHYYFPLVVLAGGLALLVRYGFSSRLWQLVGCALVAFPIFALSHPYFVDQLMNMLNRRGSNFSLSMLDNRISAIINASVSMFVDNVAVRFNVSSYSRLLLPTLA